MTVEIKVLKSQWANEKEPHIVRHNTEMLNPQAEFAKELIARWGMVQGFDNGEDTAGRHQFGLMSPSDVVKRAIEVSDLMYKAFADDNMLIEIPTLEEMKIMTAEKEDVEKQELILERLKAKMEASEKAKETE